MQYFTSPFHSMFRCIIPSSFTMVVDQSPSCAGISEIAQNVLKHAQSGVIWKEALELIYHVRPEAWFCAFVINQIAVSFKWVCSFSSISATNVCRYVLLRGTFCLGRGTCLSSALWKDHFTYRDCKQWRSAALKRHLRSPVQCLLRLVQTAHFTTLHFLRNAIFHSI